MPTISHFPEERCDGDHVIDPVRMGPDSWQGKAVSRMNKPSFVRILDEGINEPAK